MNKQDLEHSIKSLFRQWVIEKNKNPIKKIRYAGPIIGEDEYEYMLEAIFNDWWSGGKFTNEAK